MGRIDAKQIPKTMQFLKEDLPSLLLSVGRIEDTDEYWSDVVNKCDIVYRKYNTEFAKHMVLALADYLDVQSKKGR